jgi:hypothetical protein
MKTHAWVRKKDCNPEIMMHTDATKNGFDVLDKHVRECNCTNKQETGV